MTLPLPSPTRACLVLPATVATTGTVSAQVRALEAAGVHVQVVPLGEPGGLPLHVSGPLGDRIRLLSEALRQRWDADRPQIVHTFDPFGGLAAVPAVPPGARLVHSPRGRLGRERSRSGSVTLAAPPADLLRLEALVLRAADAVVVSSHAEHRELVLAGVPRQRCFVVPAGADPTHFTPDGPTAPRLDRPRIVMVSRNCDACSGVDRVIRAIRGDNDIELLVAGGPPVGGPTAERSVRRLHDLAEELGIGHRVRLLGHVPYARLPALLRSADLVVSAARRTGGTPVVEAMACGRAVVATAVGGAADAVVEGTTGRLIREDADGDLRAAILELVDNAVIREGYGLAGVHRVAARHTWDKVAAATLSAYCPDRPVDLGRAPRRRPLRGQVARRRVRTLSS